MHIKNIIIDGFKSYGNRTEIGPFDSQFNAITGLNGTGKSNILDSICFVLGISNLSNVRASNLQDLVYKSGQAGITKATVTILFDNRNKKASPLNYENYDEIAVTRQIQLGGKNKYLINGVAVQNKRVIDFFISVQLNVNNPNFLIMQGRITKVLNMKPMEILSLIEEAAGTRSYETKREIANKTVEKKDDKLGEISALINDEVAPRLEKLRADKALFLDYQKLKRDLDLYKRLFVAYRCTTIKNTINNGEKERDAILQTLSDFEDKIKSHEVECKNIDTFLKELLKRNSSENEEFKKIEAELKEHTKTETTLNVSYKASLNSVKQEIENIKLLQKSLDDDKKLLESKEAIMSKADETFKELKDADEKDSKALEIAEKRLMAISAGLSADEEGNTISLQDQLIKAQGTLTSSQSLCKQFEMELSHYKNELSELEKETHGADAKYKSDQNNATRLEKELENFKAKIRNMAYSEETFRNLTSTQRELIQECRAIKSKLERMRSSNHRLNFEYCDPEPNFNRKRVRGMFCRLFKPASDEFRLALETCAGSRLYNIVVDTEDTGKKILKNGKLKSRITLIPLNKITPNSINKETEDLAKQLVGAGKVHAALNIINFSQIDAPAMAFVFGGTFICEDIDTARKVAFHSDIKRRCISLSGDTMDPAGTLSGGAVMTSASILEILSEMDKLQYALSTKEEELQRVEAKIREMNGLADKYTVTKNRIEVMTIELQTVQRRLEQTDFHHHQEEIKKFKENIESHTKLLKDTKATFEQAKGTVADLSAKVKDAKGYRDKELKQAKTDLENAKKKSAESRKKWQNREQEYQFMTIEISELKKNTEESFQQILNAEKGIKELQEKSNQIQEELTSAKERTKELQNVLNELKSAVSKKNAEMQKKVNQKENLQKEIDDLKLELKKTDQQVKKQERDMEDSKRTYQLMKNENDWIKDEEHLFGQSGTCYDFNSHDMKEVSRKITHMSESKESMERNLNHKAMTSLANEESFYRGAVQKKELVETDQNWLMNTMGVLDNVKKLTIEEAYRQVNKDFGSIYSTLLPGTNAKLQPLEGKSALEGLEVKVAFNNIWKDSLSELSGGQRSLVALSLILAMLRYKPAPLYILDEVDAALDLSHTQNIGQMLKNHFKGSQFIIVSLKEGMFNNASVLFQTRFINGLSSVIRTIQDQKKRQTENNDPKVLPSTSNVKRVKS